MDLCNFQDIKALLGRYGFHFSKSMGQNFLIEDWVPRDIAAASGAGSGTGVREIGPGIGPLTRELCAQMCIRDRDYGAFSLYMQYHTEPEVLFDVPPTCFYPAPKVTSAVLHCPVRTTPPVLSLIHIYSPSCKGFVLYRRRERREKPDLPHDYAV